jgi:hypothetical protein
MDMDTQRVPFAAQNKKMWKRFLERHRLSSVVREPSITLLTGVRFPIDKRPS